MKKTVRIDRGTIKTKNNIIKALTELMIEKDYTEITVKEVSERANINRKTFYSYYDCLDDIVDDLQVEITERIIKFYREYNNNPNVNIASYIDAFNSMLNENYELYKRIIVANSYKFFSRNIKDLLKVAFIRHYKKATGVKPEILDLCAEYVASGLAKMYKVWFEDPKDITLTELSNLALNIVVNGISNILNQ